MMARLMRRGESFAREAQRKSVMRLATRMRAVFRGASVEVEEARVVVRGQGLVKRWLIDPELRFLSGDLK